MDVRTLSQRTLLKLGARSSEKTIHYLNGLLDYVELGWWLRHRGFTTGAQVFSCTAVFDAIAAEVADDPVLYLQFGAEDGGISARWAKLLRNPETRLHVFDPADGRAGSWLPARGRGHLWASPAASHSTGETIRKLTEEDPRIRYFAGDFSHTLSDYEWPDAETVVAVFDTDLYSSTKAALDFVGKRLPIGSFIFFDQLNHRADELRAFHEFLLESDARFERFAANRVLSCIAFRRTA